jgi:hypothetical protein
MLRARRRRTFIEDYRFSRALRMKLREALDLDDVSEVLEGLRAWYLACLYARGQTLGMPSRAVDVAWHEMILMTREYHSFCEQAFGRYLHHEPESMMLSSMDDALACALVVVDKHGIAPASAMAGVPLLFAVDAQVGIANGRHWQADDLDRLRYRAAALAHQARTAPVGSSGSWSDGRGGDGGGADGGGGGCGGGCGGGG